MYFYLAHSGELILRDLSPRRTVITVEDETPENQKLYALSGEPRQGVIPKGGALRTAIVFGYQTQFLFIWSSIVSLR